jgi:AcrR family transcriptional regulator
MEKDKRERILDSALQMFVQNGFEKSPTSKISKNAGVAAGTLFHYFDTKETLINELYLEIKRDFVTALRQNLEQSKTIRQKLETIWFNGVSWVVHKPESYRFITMFSSSSYISEKTRAEGFEKFTFILDILQQGIEEEMFKDMNVRMMNEVLFSLIFGIARAFQDAPEDLNIPENRRNVFSVVWDAFKR